jgi:hypothetical protein
MAAAAGAPSDNQHQGSHDQRGSEAPKSRLQIVHHRHVSAFPAPPRYIARQHHGKKIPSPARIPDAIAAQRSYLP